MKRLKDKSDVPEARLGTLAQKHLQAQRERQSCILLACGKVGGKRVCGRFRSKYAYGQQTRPQLC